MFRGARRRVVGWVGWVGAFVVGIALASAQQATASSETKRSDASLSSAPSAGTRAPGTGTVAPRAMQESRGVVWSILGVAAVLGVILLIWRTSAERSKEVGGS